MWALYFDAHLLPLYVIEQTQNSHYRSDAICQTSMTHVSYIATVPSFGSGV